MNPTPTSSMQRPMASGARSTRAPRASSTSALPQPEVTARLPCLATLAPAPAATNAAPVEMFTVDGPPPVPQVSTSMWESSTATCSARWRTACTSPESSVAVAPFARSAVRNAATCISLASPSIITPTARSTRSRERSSPATRRSRHSVSTGSGVTRTSRGSS